MRRLALALLVTSFTAVTAYTGTILPAVAASPLTGRLVSEAGSHPPIVGATVRLRELGPDSEPGTVVDTDVTDATGRFSLSAGSSTEEEFYVQVMPGRYRGGYVGGDPLWVQMTPGDAMTFGAHATLGRVFDYPAFIHGVVVDSKSLKPVKGVKVTVRSNDLGFLEGSDVTDGHGEFDVGHLRCEDDCALKLNGSAVGHETGYRACNATVVASWGDACASPLGRIGRVFLDPSAA